MVSANIKFGLLLAVLITSTVYLSFGQFKSTKLTEFESWKLKHNINYESVFQNAYREKIFIENKLIVQEHNKNPSRTYNKGINKFSAMTNQEFKQTYLTYKSEKSVINTPQNQLIDSDALPTATVDWRTKGAVGPIKNQGSCGSCWAFSTVAGVEAISAIYYNKLQSFSEQQLIDCNLLNNGCHGGQMRRAVNFIKQNGTLTSQEYPYKGVQGTCLKGKGNFFVSGYSNASSCNQLANALTSRPVIAGVDSTNWKDYDSGIFNGCPTDRGEFNHGILVVGMTSDAWIIKNSWSAQWGQNGFIRLKMGDMCNVCDDGIVPYK